LLNSGRGQQVAASVIADQDPAELASAINCFASLCEGAERCRGSVITALAREVGVPGNGADLPARFSDRLRDSAAAANFTFLADLGGQQSENRQ
jgi:hypothetical protein